MGARELAEEMLDLFTGYAGAHGIYYVHDEHGNVIKDARGKVKGKAVTEKGPLTVDDWLRHMRGVEPGVGSIPLLINNAVRWAAIDVDIYRDLDFDQIEKNIGDLPLVPCKSKSGGVHLYLFLKEPVEATLVLEKMSEWAAALGIGGSEIFPKQTARTSPNDIGNWINMPYFKAVGSDRHAFYQGKALTLPQFLQFAKSRQITRQQLLAINVLKYDEGGEFEDGPPCLQLLSKNGFPEGTRNNALFSIAVYFKRKNPDGWEEAVVAYNQTNMDPPLSKREVDQTIKSVARKDYVYRCKQPPLCDVCNKKLCLTRDFGIGMAHGDNVVTYGSLTKVVPPDNMEPVYIWEINGQRVELDVDEVVSQSKFRKKIFEKLDMLPAKMSDHLWEKQINDAASTIEIVNAPVDASPHYRLWQYVYQFATGRAQAKVKEQITSGRPWKNDGRIYFRVMDLEAYLKTRSFNSLRVGNKMWQALKPYGVEQAIFDIEGQRIDVWSIPADALPPGEPEPEVAA